jgi:hypothetical protein
MFYRKHGEKPKKLGLSCAVPVLLLVVVAGAQAVIPGWESKLRNRLAEFQSCSVQDDDLSPCNRFVGRAIAEVYGIDDFKDPTNKGQYLSANLIDTYLVTSHNWVPLGDANSQRSLDEAAMAANKGRAVLAVRQGEKHGHVAIILPVSQLEFDCSQFSQLFLGQSGSVLCW